MLSNRLFSRFCVLQNGLKNSGLMYPQQKCYKFVLTGGPCAGKTSALNYLQERFQPQFKVILVPELATITMQSGVPLNMPMDIESHARFTNNFMQQQMDLENYFIKQSSLINNDIIIICDRGMLDNTAYCSDQVENLVYQRTGWTRENLMNERYDQIIHLVTAANGAEDYYTLENNVARSETVEQARELDQRTQRAWLGHHNHAIIGNELSFKEKLERVYKRMCAVVDIPADVNYVLKWRLDPTHKIEWPADLRIVSNKEQIDYLETDLKGHVSWVKHRQGPNGGKTYTYTVRKLAKKESERMELKRSINREMYRSLLSSRKDFGKRTLLKEVTVFLWEGKTYLVDYYYESGDSILRMSDAGVSEGSSVQLPPFLKVMDEVSNDPKYFMHNITQY